ncbi:MAG TPA: translation elongation factor 4 [Candidatus Polarisedimenticolia bacterium]|nr:translation elongation factor 4 [Candidatus Polarisedimenticolia bacterium]
METRRIRNFCIIAHIDHGKTTLSDRFLELAGAYTLREMSDQMLDNMDLEKERGITIKAHAVALEYTANDGVAYRLNLIDTPGHVDFAYEVSRSLSACEGALLVVDGTQGVEAQTLANAYMAVDHHLHVMPVINKIDLPSAEPEKIKEQVENIIGISTENALTCSAKSGLGVKEILEAVVRDVPPPRGDVDAPLKALVFDSWFDAYRGVTILARVMEGTIRRGQPITLMATRQKYTAEEIGLLTPKPVPVEELGAGEVGFVIANIRNAVEVKIGDTITDPRRPTAEPFPGFQEMKPMVFAGLFPIGESGYDALRDALEKLRLNDASFSVEPENSEALGFGFRCGFLGLLHMEIVQQRLERHFGLSLITTAPSVRYRIKTTDGETLEISNPARLPPPQKIDTWEEPVITCLILTPPEHVGGILALCQDKRGVQKDLKYVTTTRVLISYDLPFNEVVIDFYDKLKTISRGYASLDYHHTGWWKSDMAKLDILVNGEPVDALSLIVHRERAAQKGRSLTQKLRQEIPRQLFEVAIQAAIGGKIVARENVSALRKNVLAKCYGGDITRKRKLLEKQKEGKKRMKKVGRVDIPQEAFLALLKVE